MNAITEFTHRPEHPTAEEPIPKLAGTPGLTLLRSGTASRLAMTVTPTEADALALTEDGLRSSLRPASAAEVAVEIEGLALHYPTFRQTEAEHRMVARHWVDDLAGWPIDLIREACRQWRNSDAERFPTSGQLKKLVEPVLAHRRLLHKRAEDFLALRIQNRA